MQAVAFAGDVPAQAPQEPRSQSFDLLDRDEVEFSIIGSLLGFGTSQRDDHQHAGTDYAPPRTRCSACRWFEVRIFVVEAEYRADDTCTCGAKNDMHQDHCGLESPRARYLVLTYGQSTVPGETTKRRAMWTDSPFEVIELLTQRNDGHPFLPVTSARALANAANQDAGMFKAYVNRAVA